MTAFTDLHFEITKYMPEVYPLLTVFSAVMKILKTILLTKIAQANLVLGSE